MFKVLKTEGRARRGEFSCAHGGVVQTPVFMNVGTQRAIKMTIEAGHRHGIWVGICGELGADTALTETFLRMGVDELSMNAKSILPVRKIIRSVDLSKPSEKA